MRRSGVLLPVTSLPSRFGIGTFSKEAYAFVDFLKEAGQKLWQILPLGPTGYGDSPYQAFSTFAGNPYLIDLEELIENGWLTEEECENTDWGGSKSYVDYEKCIRDVFPCCARHTTTAISQRMLNLLHSVRKMTGGFLSMRCLWRSRTVRAAQASWNGTHL